MVLFLTLIALCNMSEEVKELRVSQAKEVADLFEVDIKISIFGHTIFEWHFPPSRK